MRTAFRREAGVGMWTVSGALYGRHQQVAVARRILKKALGAPGRKFLVLTERKLSMGLFVANLLGDSAWGRGLRDQVRMGQALFDLNRGVPNGQFLAGSYWRRRGGLPQAFPAGADPAADACGLLWVAPVIPMRGEDVLRLHGIIEPLFEKFDFDAFVTHSMISERALGSVITIAYDQEDAAETGRAIFLYRALLDGVMEAGYLPYRVGIQSMADLEKGSSGFWNVTGAIKGVLDPLGIMAPGRYEPTRARRM